MRLVPEGARVQGPGVEYEGKGLVFAKPCEFGRKTFINCDSFLNFHAQTTLRFVFLELSIHAQAIISMFIFREHRGDQSIGAQIKQTFVVLE